MSAPDVWIVTAANLPKPDPETHLLVAALNTMGVASQVVAWEDATIDWAAAKLALIRTPWNYTAHVDAFLAWVARVAKLTRLENPGHVVTWNAHKQYLTQLGSVGVHVLPTLIIKKGDANFDKTLLPPGVVVAKPAIGGGARGAMKAAHDDPALLAHITSLLPNHDVLIQPFADSVATRGEVSLIYFGNTFSHAVRKVPKAGDFRIHTYYGGSVLDYTPTTAEFKMAERALAATPAPCTYARVDMVDYAGAPAVMELEVIEPELFLGRTPSAPQHFAEAIQKIL